MPPQPRTSFLRWVPDSMGLLVSTSLLVAASSADPAHRDAIALAVVFDTSGSMNQPIPTKPGSPPDSKVRIAQRAFGKVLDRLETFAQAPGARPLLVGTYVFAGSEARTAHPLRPFNAAQLRHWLANLRPHGPTPLGAALFSAARDLLSAPAGSRHLLVLTDGANTMGPTPEKVLAQIAEACTRKEVPIFTHVIALDIKPEVFSALKRMGATLIGAIDETQLNSQFDFILEEKILVEAPR